MQTKKQKFSNIYKIEKFWLPLRDNFVYQKTKNRSEYELEKDHL